MRPCHPLPLPVPALGTSTAATGSGGGCRDSNVPVAQLPLPPQADSKWLLFGGERWPRAGESHWWECAKPPAASCRLWDISQRPRARRGSCTPTRCLCGTWRSSSSALPVAAPLGGPVPCTPLSKTPSTLQGAPHPGKGLNPQGGGDAGTGTMLLGNGLLWSWQGNFWSRWSGSKEQEQRQEQCWAWPQVPRTPPQADPLQLLHVLPWQSSWDEKQPLCLCAGLQRIEQCEIIQPSWELQLDV